MSNPSDITVNLDCRGQQCPTPILALSKQSRKMAQSGGEIVVLSDDAAFPLDLKAWCRSAGAQILELVSEDDGLHRARVLLTAKTKSPPVGSPPQARGADGEHHIVSGEIRVPPQVAAQTAAVASNADSALSPPVSHTSADVIPLYTPQKTNPSGLDFAAQGLSGGPEQDSGFAEIKSLDCRGTRCPEPILRLSRLSRDAQPGTIVEIRADDEAFPLDLKSWCRSSRAVLESFEEQGDGDKRSYLACVRLCAKKRASVTSSTSGTAVLPRAPGKPPQALPVFQGNTAVSSARQASVAPPATLGESPNNATHLESQVNPGQLAAAKPMADVLLTVDLRPLPSENWETVLASNISALQPGQKIAVFLKPDTQNSAQNTEWLTRWVVHQGHRLHELSSHDSVCATIEIGQGSPQESKASQSQALQKLDSAADCTLLVLHNDHEALLAALLVAVGAASQGKEVVIFFTFWGLNLLRGDAPNLEEPKERSSWMQWMMKKMMPRGPERQAMGKMNYGGMGKWMLGHIMKQNNIMSLSELMEEAEELGVRFVACTMSMEVMGICKRDLQGRKNLEYGGVATFVEAAHGSGMSLVF